MVDWHGCDFLRNPTPFLLIGKQLTTIWTTHYIVIDFHRRKKSFVLQSGCFWCTRIFTIFRGNLQHFCEKENEDRRKINHSKVKTSQTITKDKRLSSKTYKFCRIVNKNRKLETASHQQNLFKTSLFLTSKHYRMGFNFWFAQNEKLLGIVNKARLLHSYNSRYLARK